MKKRIISIIAAIVMSVNMGYIVGYADNDISVILDGTPIEFDVPPQIIGDRTMVPLRKIFEAMGANVEWNNDTQTVTATKNNEQVIATIDSTTVYIGGEPKVLDVPPMIVNDRTLVPVRFVAESFGANVEWDDNEQIVYITSGANNIPYYVNYPGIPDFGAIIGVPNIADDPNMVPCYDISTFTAEELVQYLDIMEREGFRVQIGDDIITCSKDGVYVDIVIFSDEMLISVTY